MSQQMISTADDSDLDDLNCDNRDDGEVEANILDHDEDEGSQSDEPPVQTTELHFPPVTVTHIMNCSYHRWHPSYRTITPKARLIPLSASFVKYLRADGIVLPSDHEPRNRLYHTDGILRGSEDQTIPDESDEDEDQDVAADWRHIHHTVRDTIAELGGRVVPKLNWSAPKDATWINANSMECLSPNDVYLLLKSSDFITHDLEHAFDDTVPSPDMDLTTASIPYHLVLRKAVSQWNPSVEFRCFVRGRRLLCLSQRELNHFDFLSKMEGRLRSLIQEFFDVRLRDTFPDDNFVFDVYVPPPYDRVWLVDFNPWAPRTDPLLFSWLEILTMPELPEDDSDLDGTDVVRLGFEPAGKLDEGTMNGVSTASKDDPVDDHLDESDAEEELWLPEFRLVGKNDPEAMNFSATQYSAHKLPKDVVDASQSGEGLRDFARDWQDILDKRRKAEEGVQDSDDN